MMTPKMKEDFCTWILVASKISEICQIINRADQFIVQN